MRSSTSCTAVLSFVPFAAAVVVLATRGFCAGAELGLGFAGLGEVLGLAAALVAAAGEDGAAPGDRGTSPGAELDSAREDWLVVGAFVPIERTVTMPAPAAAVISTAAMIGLTAKWPRCPACGATRCDEVPCLARCPGIRVPGPLPEPDASGAGFADGAGLDGRWVRPCIVPCVEASM